MSPCCVDRIIPPGCADTACLFISLSCVAFLLTSAADPTLASVSPLFCLLSALLAVSLVPEADLVFFHAEHVIFTQPKRVSISPEHC